MWHKYIASLVGGTLTSLLAWTAAVLATICLLGGLRGVFTYGLWPGVPISALLMALGAGLGLTSAALFRMDERLLHTQGTAGRAVSPSRARGHRRRIGRTHACVRVGSQAIHFELRAGRSKDEAASASAQERARAYILCILPLMGVLFAARALLNLTPNQIGVLILLGFAGLLGYEGWRAYAAHRRGLQSGLPNAVRGACRVRCVGFPDDFEALGGFGDYPFEPAIFNCSWTSLAHIRPVVRRSYVLAVVASAVLLFSGIGLATGRFTSLPLFLSPSLAYVITAIFWHTYISVVPGRMDVVQMPVFRRDRCYKLASVNLRIAHVVVNSRKAYVRIKGPGSGDFAFATSLLLNRRHLEYMVLLAAVSTHAAGPTEELPAGG